eukprot:IDg12101t1
MPHCFGKSKNFILKVMFLCAVARPSFVYHFKLELDGKIGNWRKRPSKSQTISIQQDNARLHVSVEDSEVVEAGQEDA